MECLFGARLEDIKAFAYLLPGPLHVAAFVHGKPGEKVLATEELGYAIELRLEVRKRRGVVGERIMDDAQREACCSGVGGLDLLVILPETHQ
jgi:hypothetical protein